MNNDDIEIFDDFDIDNGQNNQVQNTSTPNTMPVNQNAQVANQNIETQTTAAIEPAVTTQASAPVINKPKSEIDSSLIEKTNVDPSKVRSIFEDPIKAEPKKKIELGENPIVEMVNNKSAMKLMAIILVILFAAVVLMPIIFQKIN